MKKITSKKQQEMDSADETAVPLYGERYGMMAADIENIGVSGHGQSTKLTNLEIVLIKHALIEKWDYERDNHPEEIMERALARLIGKLHKENARRRQQVIKKGKSK